MSKKEQPKPYRTKVVVGTGSVFGAAGTSVMAYAPSTDLSGEYILDGNGHCTKLVRLGGVKIGSVGEVVGPALKAPRTFLLEYEKTASLGIDLVEMIPVELTEYQRIAWFPSHIVRVVG